MTPFSQVVPGTVSSMKPFGPLGEQLTGQCSHLRILDADVYDTVEFVAETVGGIGAGTFWRSLPVGLGWDYECPVCVHGCGRFGAGRTDGENPVSRALHYAGINYEDNDSAVRNVNYRLGKGRADDRIPFELWRQELCIVRGVHPDPSPDASWPTQAKANKRCFDGASTSPNASI